MAAFWLYAVPYLIAVAMPGPRWLFGYVIACFGCVAVYVAWAFTLSGSDDATDAAIGILGFFILAVPGMMSGYFARILTLVLGRFREHPLSYTTIVLVGLFWYPALIFGPKLAKQLL